MTDVSRLIQRTIRHSQQRKKFADGGDVADDMIEDARLKLASQPERLRDILPDVGDPLIGGGGQFSPGTRWGNKAADVGGKLAAGMARGMIELPRRAIENSQNSLDTGEYDPSAPIDAALLTLGAGAGARGGLRPVNPHGGTVDPSARVTYNPANGAQDAGSAAEAAPLDRTGVAGSPGGGEGLRTPELQAERRAAGRPVLPGLPTGRQQVGGQDFIPGPVGSVHDVADRYMASRETPSYHKPPEKYHELDKEHSAAIARAYEEMPHAPNDPAVKASYEALIKETLAQYQAIKASGLKITPVGGADYPYHGNPRQVAQDVADNNHMAFFKTDEGFGTGDAMHPDNPMLLSSGEKIGDHDLLNNDIFRIVHDYFGHIKNGYGFRAAGEDNAWRAHAAMYSDIARPAMTTETRGQNSWVNYGPHGEKNRTASGADTIYADQKVGLMPEWTMRDRGSPDPIIAYQGSAAKFDKHNPEYIGTGEGNQAYGHGLYFAVHEPVGEWYRHQLSARRDPLLAKYGLDSEQGANLGISLASAKGDTQQVIASIQQGLDQLLAERAAGRTDKATQNMIRDRQNKIAYLQDPARNQGHLYQVAIDHPPEKFLDWDKPITEQHQSIQDWIAAHPKAARLQGGDMVRGQMRNPTGEAILQRLRAVSDSPEQELARAGIPGIRYLDQLSRDQGQGSHNYVTFDAPRMLRRYAEGGAVGDDYNTPVPDEAAFQQWKALNAPDDSGVDYDLRGAYLANMQRADNGHMGDQFKKPNHPTFSDQSQYAVGDQLSRAGHWVGETFVPPVAYAEGGEVPADEEVDWSKLNQPAGEMRAATYTPTQRIGNVVADGLQKLGMQPYTANDLTSRVGEVVKASPLGVAGAALDAIDAKRRGDITGTVSAMAGMIPGAKGARGAVARVVDDADIATKVKNVARRYYEGAPVINAGVYAPINKSIQTVADPYRMMFPGIYRNPREIAEEAASRVGPEDPAMKQLWGVTRGDLRDMAVGRVGNEEPIVPLAQRFRGSLAAQNIDTPKNTQRLVDILGETGKHEGLRTADSWYIMDPVYRRLEQMFGPEEAVRRYRHLNTTTAMASPGSDVMTEIQRGTGAHWLQNQGRFDDFVKYGGLTGPARQSLKVPADVRYIQGHPYHKTSQSAPMQKYFDTGAIQSESPKVPLYAHASGVPETGFQTTGPVGDAHFSRGVGLSDTRRGPTDVGSSFSRAEYQTLQPWWQHSVAGKVGLESVPAQARLWTGLGPQTGVESELGAPKLELLSKQIMQAARRLKVSPETARDLILSGKAGAGVLTGAAIAPSLFRSEEDRPMRTGGRVRRYAEGGGVDDDEAPVFDPAKLAAVKPAAPAFDPAKLAAAKATSSEPKTISERLQKVWANPTSGGPVWMAKEIYEGIRNSVDAAKIAGSGWQPSTEDEAYRYNQLQDRRGVDALRAVQFLSPSAPKGTGGIFAAPQGGSARAAAALVSPEAQANRELAREFDIPLSRGQATRDLDQIRYEDMAARDAYGKDAQDRAAGFFNRQYDAIQNGGQQVGQTVARGEQPLGSPINAGASLNTEVADSAARAAAARDLIIQRAEQAAAEQRAQVAERGRALDETIGQPGRPLAEPRQAGELANQGVRDAAAQDKAFYQAKYEDVGRRPGQFSTDAFEGVGSRIRNDLTFHADPVEITDLTPAARHAIEALDQWSVPSVKNAADPRAPFADTPTSITLKGVDTFMRRLSSFYKSTQPGTEDRRAMGRIMGEFGNQVEKAMADGLFSGDPEALAVLREAKDAFARYQRTYKPREAGDDVGTAMRRIVERNATPEETANMIIGSGKIGNAGLPVRIADRLQEVLGADSDAYRAIRQAMWQKASQVRNRAGEIDPAASARSIEDFVGSSLAARMFPQERAAMRSHAQGIRDLDRVIESMPETAAATRAHQLYQEAFSGDHLSGSQRAVFRRMVDGSATPEETAQVMFSAIGGGNPGDAARALQAVERIVGKDSPVMNTVRQGVWQRLTQEPFGKDQKGQQKMVQAISEFLNGKGGTVARQLYSEEERRLMNRFVDAVKLTIIPKYARTNSDTTPAMLAAINKYAGVVTSALGAIFHGGASGGAEGYAVKKAIEWGAGKVGMIKEGRKLNDSLEDVIPKPPRRPLPVPPAALRALPNAPKALLGDDNRNNPYAR